MFKLTYRAKHSSQREKSGHTHSHPTRHRFYWYEQTQPGKNLEEDIDDVGDDDKNAEDILTTNTAEGI